MSRVGIVGGGQLGRMLALAGHDLGITCLTLDPAADSSAAAVAPAIVGAYDDHDRLAELAARCDLVTYEFENVPVDAARFARANAAGAPAAGRPRGRAGSARREGAVHRRSGCRCPRTRAVDSLAESRRRPRAHRHAGGAEDAAPRLRRQGAGRDPRSAADAEDAWRSVGEVPLPARGVRRIRPRAVDRGRPHGATGTAAAYPARREPSP